MNYNQGKDHPKFIDLTGKTFGQLTILEYVKVPEKTQDVWKWKCKCSCGEFTFTRTKEFLKANPVQSCRACGIKRMSKNRVLPDNLSQKNRTYRIYKRGATNRGYSFDLTFEQVTQLTNQPCHYCDLLSSPRNGIDRVDNTKGYSIDNVVPCCSVCNRAKMEMSYEDFLAFIHRVYNNLINK